MAYGTAELKNAKVDPEKGGKLVIPKGDYGWTYQELTDDVYKRHLEGTLSIGVQPCNENSEAKFGVIDIDPKDYVGFDRQYIIEKIQEYKLPLVPVLSKSGGLHLYLFMNEFVLATLIVSFLSNLLSLFKLKSNNEIFPKQTQLQGS